MTVAVARDKGEAVLEPDKRLLPILAPIGFDCLDIGVTQRQSLARNLTFAAELARRNYA
jgi:hypothetical protein